MGAAQACVGLARLACDRGRIAIAVHSSHELSSYLHANAIVGARREPLRGLQRRRCLRLVRVSIVYRASFNFRGWTAEHALVQLEQCKQHCSFSARGGLRQDIAHGHHIWRVYSRWNLPPIPDDWRLCRSGCWHRHGEYSKSSSDCLAVLGMPSGRTLHLTARVRCRWSRECTRRGHSYDCQLGKYQLIVRTTMGGKTDDSGEQVVILFELTGAIDLVLQIMMAGKQS